MLHFNSLRLVFNLNRGLFKIKSCKSLICEFRRAVLKEERVLSESYNKMIQSFNFLIIGRCGSGKSATTRQLTGCEHIQVRNSPNSVTKNVGFYESTASKMDRNKVRFGIMDIPGLDEVQNRKIIRQVILEEMEQRNIDFDAILYTVDCVTRDSVDNRKIFNFLNELPWSLRDTKECLIPILTKYDNLVFDAEDENTKRTLQQFGHIFKENNYEESWRHNSLYWVNPTKNIEKKMGICNEIKEIYDSQLDKLLIMLTRKKTRLTRDKIRQYLEEEEAYIQRKAKTLIRNQQITMRAASCVISHQLTIELSRQEHTQNYTAMTLGGMGVMLTKIIKSDLGKAALAIGTVLVTGGVILRNLLRQSSLIKARQEQRHELKLRYDNTYIIQNIYKAISSNLREYEQQIRFVIQGNILLVQLPDNFEGEYFTISKNSATECYLDDVRLHRSQRGDFEYQFHEEEESKTLVSVVKIRFVLLVPEEQALLDKFEQESYNFKKELDMMY